jgi:hypothetical protein
MARAFSPRYCASCCLAVSSNGYLSKSRSSALDLFTLVGSFAVLALVSGVTLRNWLPEAHAHFLIRAGLAAFVTAQAIGIMVEVFPALR